MHKLLGFVAMLVLAVVLFKGISGGVENVTRGFNEDLGSFMDRAMSGSTINTDSPFSMFPETTVAAVEAVDKGLGFVEVLLTALLLSFVGVAVMCIYFHLDYERTKQDRTKAYLDQTMNNGRRY